MKNFIIALMFLVVLGTFFESSAAADKNECKEVNPWIGIVEARLGENVDLVKLRELAAKLKFDWGNIVVCQKLGNRVIFIIDENGPAIEINTETPYKELGGIKPFRLSPVSHFQIVIMSYGRSVQNLSYASEFERLTMEQSFIFRKK